MNPQPKPTRAARLAKQREKRRAAQDSMADLRDARMDVAKGTCEWWTTPSVRCPESSALHLHHMLGGSGQRRQKQTLETVRIYCARHHRAAHGLKA